MKRILLLLAVAAGLLAAQTVAAVAGPIRTFAISGLFRDGAVMSGTVTIDEGAGRVVGCHITVVGRRTVHFDRVEVRTVVGKAEVIQMAPAHLDWPKLIIGEQTFPGSVRGYAGGPLGPRTDILHADRSFLLILSGHLIPMPQSSA